MWPFAEERVEFVGGPFCGEATRAGALWLYKVSHVGITHVYQRLNGAYRHCP